jgi:hypothetical protein
MFALPGMGFAQEERRGGALKEGIANRFRCRHEHMIGQFTMIGYCYFLLASCALIKRRYTKGKRYYQV